MTRRTLGPSRTASCSAVLPLVGPRTFTSAPSSTRTWTASAWPLNTATCTAGRPSLLTHCALAPYTQWTTTCHVLHTTMTRHGVVVHCLTPSQSAVPNYCCSKGSVPYWSNTIFNFWHSGALALSPERQSARMSKIKEMVVRPVWQSVKPYNAIGSERVNESRCSGFRPIHIDCPFREPQTL